MLFLNQQYQSHEGNTATLVNFHLSHLSDLLNYAQFSVLLYLVLVLVLKLYLSTFFGYWYWYVYLHAKYWYLYWYLNFSTGTGTGTCNKVLVAKNKIFLCCLTLQV